MMCVIIAGDAAGSTIDSVSMDVNIAQDSKEPGFQIDGRGVRVERALGAQIGLLHQNLGVLRLFG
jgi:hypothetical protein